ncbi:MAG TPA: hypothetical protein VFR61_00545 [Nitrososphaeraceae archaeon]|nr:hypothetical protein [Nitrososphaeraceae archaeon]
MTQKGMALLRILEQMACIFNEILLKTSLKIRNYDTQEVFRCEHRQNN